MIWFIVKILGGTCVSLLFTYLSIQLGINIYKKLNGASGGRLGDSVEAACKSLSEKIANLESSHASKDEKIRELKDKIRKMESSENSKKS